METGFFRGEGGTVWEMDLPLSGYAAANCEKGLLRRVNPDGSDWEDPTVDVVVPVKKAAKKAAPAPDAGEVA